MKFYKPCAKVRIFLTLITVLITTNILNASKLKDSIKDVNVIRHALLIHNIGNYGTKAAYSDEIVKLIITDQWQTPQQGQSVKLNDGNEVQWQSISADEEGWFTQKSKGGYIYAEIQSDTDKPALLSILGPSTFYFNLEPHVGNQYTYKEDFEPWEPNFNFTYIPVKLNKGTNQILVQRTWRSGGKVKIKVIQPRAPILINGFDTTLPDLLINQPIDTHGGIVIINTKEQTQKDLKIIAKWPDGSKTITDVPVIESLTVRKIPFALKHDPFTESKEVNVKLSISSDEQTIDSWDISLHIKNPNQNRKITYISEIDGSVQYYALNPVIKTDTPNPPALVFSTHGADVEASNQAGSYASKTWCNIVAPTNRRPFGFDWEDWGRMDFLEVEKHAKTNLSYNPTCVYITGHSMGGHGTWILGSTFPDKFAAIGPSAGWISFWSYRGATLEEEPTDIDAMLTRTQKPGDTIALSRNLTNKGVYIIHGGADDNVRPEQSHIMVENLKTFHNDWIYHEEPNQGHWWDISKDPGTDCVDWRPMFDFFARHRIPKNDQIRNVNFTTANPSISSTSHWLGIYSQLHPLQISNADITYEPHNNIFTGTTNNVETISLDLNHLFSSKALTINIDDQKIENIPFPAGRKLWLKNTSGKWNVSEKPLDKLKGPHRYGPFKEVFTHNMVFVYGTDGTDAENKWSVTKAKFDAEQWWYQGNGSVDIISDTEFKPEDYKDRSVILYGNSRTNIAWDTLLADSPVKINENSVTIGDKNISGQNLACLFIQPRQDSDIASVAAISGTTLTGMKLTDRLNYFLAGSAFPDCIVIDIDMLEKGNDGIKAAGFFGNDWKVETGDWAWHNKERPKMPEKKQEPQKPAKNQARKLPDIDGPDPRPFVMPRSYVCMKAFDEIIVDGKLDEPSWQDAQWTQPHVDIQGQMNPVEPRFKTQTKMIWDDTYLYVGAILYEPHIWGTITERNAVIFNDNDFEVFIDPDGDSHNYFEFEINALNTVWNLLLKKPYKHGGPAKVREMPGQKSGIFINGTLNDTNDIDQYWTVEIAFPFDAMKEYANMPCPPQDGDQWRVNFSRVEWQHKIENNKYLRIPQKGEKSDIHEDNWIWSPQGVINMHRPETWGYVQFSTKPVGSSNVEFVKDQTAWARYLLHKILYAQQEYKLNNNKYTDNLNDLELGALKDDSFLNMVTLISDSTSFNASINLTMDSNQTKTLTVYHDGKLAVK